VSITHQQLLAKIEQQVVQAKRVPSSQMREHLYAIRTLCDLALDQEAGSVSSAAQPAMTADTLAPTPVYQPPAQPNVSYPKDKPIQMEDGSNGDSLFDF